MPLFYWESMISGNMKHKKKEKHKSNKESCQAREKNIIFKKEFKLYSISQEKEIDMRAKI